MTHEKMIEYLPKGLYKSYLQFLINIVVLEDVF